MDIYTSLEQAKEEVWKRWNDDKLRKEVAEFVGEIPEPLRDGPRAVLFRNVMTPDNEFIHFVKESKRAGLSPLGLEFAEDKFCTRNADKIGLGRMSFLNKSNGNGDAAFHYRRVIDMKGCDGQRFCDINTAWGENLVSFHHRMIDLVSQGTSLHDLSAWIEKRGKKAASYYPHFIALFTCHGVLMENFVNSGSEKEFTESVSRPAFMAVSKRFGVKPLIVPIMPDNETDNVYWWCYPDVVEAEIHRYV